MEDTFQPCGLCKVPVPSLSLEYVGKVCEGCRIIAALYKTFPCKVCSKEIPTVHVVNGLCASCVQKKLDSIDKKLSEWDSVSVDLVRNMLRL